MNQLTHQPLMYAQGDVLIVPATIPAEAVQSEGGKRIVLALGEASGHAHVIDDPEVVEFTLKDAATAVWQFLRVVGLGGADVKHVHGTALTGEHDTIHLPPGDYEKVPQTTWAGSEARRAAD